MSGTRSGRAILALAMSVLVLAGCGADEDAEPGSTEVSGEVTVFAAASLTEAFTRIGAAFESANPGTKVTFNFAGSSGLATQINQGAPADVFAAASPATMKTVTDAGHGAGEPSVFVRNQLVIAVANGNPDGFHRLADLTRPGTKVALCAEQVPCGAAAKKALAAAKVKVQPVTLEQDVKSALAKVRLGEVDAALVYRTDAISAPAEIDGVEFDESAAAINDYPVVALKEAPNPTAAQAFVSHLRSVQARAVLTDAGFQVP